MNFRELYTQSKPQITEAIIGMWREIAPRMVELYGEQLNGIVSQCISENIVVENMAHWTTVDDDDWRNVISDKIWRKYEKDKDGNRTGGIVEIPNKPYKHQYESWKALLTDVNTKSIVVTSGTGSGKTECFMMPLIHDLTKHQTDGQRNQAIEAIFLYPLNALMEDQKERIDNYITFSEKKLQFAVYNGNTPENENDPKWDYAVDDNGEVVKPYANEILTREAIRNEKPNILFTNPSMLEYMLLRHKDDAIFTDQLKWIVIDETHTYKGSAGAELALLLRRVLKACGKDASDVKFATSSATIGNAPDAERELKEFISAITGHDIKNIARIEGKRSVPNTANEGLRNKLASNDFILLKDLIKGCSIEDMLATLDNESDNGLRVRLHYYLQSLNMGLYVDPRKVENGKFLLTRSIPMVDGKLDSHYLEAYFCKECGALLGYGEVEDEKYRRRVKEDIATLEELGDDEDDEDDGDINSENTKDDRTGEFYVGLSASNIDGNPNHCNWDISDDGDSFITNGSTFKIKEVDIKSNRVGAKIIHHCPCCGKHGMGKDKPMKSFHMSADYVSRLIAPILLDQTSQVQDNPEKGIKADRLPRQGHKYITFADSRQSVAGPTIKQNLETEEVWVTGVLYKKLLECNKNLPCNIEYCKEDIQTAQRRGQTDKIEELDNELRKLRSFQINGCYLTWNEALDALLDDKDNFERMFLAFAKKYVKNDDESRKKYALSALYRVMNRRLGRGKNSPENWGLMCSTYPDLYKLKDRELKDAISEFNSLISDDSLKISKEDWYNYVKLFVDYEIRGHQRFFFDRRSDAGWGQIDYNATRDYRTGYDKRRPIDGYSDSIKIGDNRYTKLLLTLLGKESIKDLDESVKVIIENVIDQLKADLVECNIKEPGQDIIWKYNKDQKKEVFDHWQESRQKREDFDNKEVTLYYMNLSRLAFKLYDDSVWLDNNVRIPLDTTFKQYSPEYVLDNGNMLYNNKCDRISWARIPIASERRFENIADIKEWWLQTYPKLGHKWTSKLGRILEYINSDKNTIYIQAEHTAQVARSIIKDKTEKFKNGEINIMACSTTMEMGVDLGDLEMVVMNNLPSHPANYKQRAGRAGRGDQNKSSSITICGSDASGSEMMRNPLSHLICAPIEPPKIKLDGSPQIIQRHVNSYLFRKFIKEKEIDLMVGAEGENDRGYKVFKFFSTYSNICYDNNSEVRKVYIDENTAIWPDEYVDIRDHNQSYYQVFIDCLNAWQKDSGVVNEVESLVRGAITANFTAVQLIQGTRAKIENIANELHKELDAIRSRYTSGRDSSGDKTLKRWNYMFTSLLGANLLSFLSTHQFTPNANMPIGIVEMVIDENERHVAENPTRDMRVALSEYAPGRMVFINDVTYRMGGVRWNHAQSFRMLKKCANNHTWMTESKDDICPVDGCNQQAVDWGDGLGKYIDVITPTGFYPYKDTSRITSKDELSIVIDTALIGVGNWVDQGDNERLYAVRTNDSDVNAEILYYNKGLGSGYYVCKDCGFAVPVPKNVGNISENEVIKNIFYPLTTQNKKRCYHDYRGWRCYFDKNNDGNIDASIHKNKVFGGTIQTDYCEIALYTSATDKLVYGDGIGDEIAITLGLMLSREFAHRIGCESQDIDFIVRRQNAEMSICIFDTAKGGSGYSKKLSDLHLLDSLLDVVRDKLSKCQSADDILDRTTMKYADKINVAATYEWLKNEYDFRQIVPDEIQRQFPGKNVRVARYDEVRSAIMNIPLGQRCTLFFDGTRINTKWNFDNGDANWDNNRYDLNNDNSTRQRVFAVTNLPTTIAQKDKDNMMAASRNRNWYKFANPLASHLFPLVQIGTTLYFTSNMNYTLLNEAWAADDLYSVDYDNQIPIEKLDIVLYGDEHYIYPAGSKIYSNGLFDKLMDDSALTRFRAFVESCRGHELDFVYHEEYMRSHLTMTMALQFMIKFAKRANAIIRNIKIIGEKYPVDRNGNYQHDYPISYQDNIIPQWLKISTSWGCYKDRDEYLKDVFMSALINNSDIYGYHVDSLDAHSLPHWRALIVRDTETGACVNILPNGGFGNDWKFDDSRWRPGGYWPKDCDIETEIPITTENGKRILYDIKVCEPLWDIND